MDEDLIKLLAGLCSDHRHSMFSPASTGISRASLMEQGHCEATRSRRIISSTDTISGTKYSYSGISGDSGLWGIAYRLAMCKTRLTLIRATRKATEESHWAQNITRTV